MSKIEKLNHLFDEWQKQAEVEGRFIADGIIDEDAWNNAPVKALYIMDDINFEPDDPNRSLGRRFCQLAQQEIWDDRYSAALGNIIRWTHGINRGYLRFQREMENFREIKESLLKCSIIVLNKCDAKKEANKDVISERVKCDRNMIREEISIIDPDLIVCCGTFGTIERDLFENKADTCCLNTGGSCLVCKNEIGGRYAFIDHYHPNNRMVQKEVMYNIIVYNLLSAHAQGFVSVEPFRKLSREMLYYMINSPDLV